jgi:spore maturation protein CgeB
MTDEIKEFCLSDLIREFEGGKDTNIYTKDVKEFIKKLKKYFTTKQSRYFIDKLAGEKLI